MWANKEEVPFLLLINPPPLKGIVTIDTLIL